MSKKKILMLSDHALSTSGVGCQSRYLIDGLIKTGRWSVRQFGAAVKHANYKNVVISDDFVIRPVDGFGTPEMLRQALALERPDVLLLFTDPRFFTWVWQMEDEVHQICPIAYWHVWDNFPVPQFNKVLYDSTDLINCHSHLTYNFVKELAPGRTNFIPHALPREIFYPIEDEGRVASIREETLGPNRKNHFILFWANRNAKRKRPNDLLWAWQLFMRMLKEKHGKSDATLLLHTQPDDQEGPNLRATAEMLEISSSLLFSSERVEFDKMNILHNISDACINISYAEGFGLATLEAMQCGRPIIALKTGGLTRQVVDHRDGTENGFSLPVEMQSMVGSQTVPYIFEDYCSAQTTAEAILKMYELGHEGRRSLGSKARKYALSEFSLERTVSDWDRTLVELTDNWKNNRNLWEKKEI